MRGVGSKLWVSSVWERARMLRVESMRKAVLALPGGQCFGDRILEMAKEESKVRAMVVVPSREVVRRMCRYGRYQMALCYVCRYRLDIVRL